MNRRADDRLPAITREFWRCVMRDWYGIRVRTHRFHAWLSRDDDRNLFRVIAVLIFLAVLFAWFTGAPAGPGAYLTAVRG